MLRESSGGIAGAAVLILRRQLANMAERVGARLVGSVLARLVSVVAGGVGLALIAKDIWDLRHGVLPIIATEMKSKDNKDKVQDELAKTFAEQISGHVDEIGAATADHVVDIWRDFRSAHAQALDLAERNPKFKAFLDSLKPQALPRLDEVVSLVLAAEGEAGLLRRLDDGTLNEAVNVLPAPAMEIARETRSVDAGLKWAALAGDQLPKVVELGLYRRTAPDTLTQGSLQRMLALNDRLAILRLASIDRGARDTLFELNDAELKSLARSLTEPELATLSRYLTGLQKEPRERVLRAVAANPAMMQSLASERVREAVVASADQTAAVDMMLRTNAALDAGADRRRTSASSPTAACRPVLMWEKHPLVDRSGARLARHRAAAAAPPAVSAPPHTGARVSGQPSAFRNKVPHADVSERIGPAISARGPSESACVWGRVRTVYAFLGHRGSGTDGTQSAWHLDVHGVDRPDGHRVDHEVLRGRDSLPRRQRILGAAGGAGHPRARLHHARALRQS